MSIQLFSRPALVATAGLLLCTNANACQLWRFGPTYTVDQSNGHRIQLRGISRNGNTFEATTQSFNASGDVSGTLEKNGRLEFTILWTNNSVGVYTAHVRESGKVIDGRTFDRAHPANWATWTGGRISCARR